MNFISRDNVIEKNTISSFLSSQFIVVRRSRANIYTHLKGKALF